MAVIRNTTHNDLYALAGCHIAAFPHTLSSALGKRYCAKMLEWYLSTDKAFIFHVEKDNTVIGYCGGIIVDGTLAHGSASSMTQYSFNEAVRAFILRPWLLLHKELIRKYSFVVRNIYRKFFNRDSRTALRTPSEARVGLVVIGVSQEYQGQGFGSILLRHFEDVVKQKGYKAMQLTVKATNEKAVSAYKQNGWIEERLQADSLYMIKRID